MNPTRELEKPNETATFLFARAEAEHQAAERKREATVTKATAVATLSAALIGIVAAPALEVGGASGGFTKWLLLATIGALVGAVGFSALALMVTVSLGERASSREFGNWSTDLFQDADVAKHARDFTEMYFKATTNIRTANQDAQARLYWAVRMVGLSLFLLSTSYVIAIL